MLSKTTFVSFLLGLTSAKDHSGKDDPYHNIEKHKGEYPYDEDFQPPEDSWDTAGQIVFLCIYAALWVLVICIVHFREPLKRAVCKCSTTPKSTKVGAEPLIPVDSGAGADHSIGPRPPYPSDKRVSELFQEAVAKDPSATALILPDGDKWTNEISYAALADLFEELASALNSLGATKGSIVALILHRSVAQIVAVWGTLQSGGGFLPIDADAPEARKEVMIKDSGAVAIIRCEEDATAAQLAKSLNIPLVSLPADGQPNQLKVENTKNNKVADRVHPETTDMALLIYTSGTTGTPKGIIYDHTHLMHGVYFYGAQTEVDSSSVTLLKSPYFWAVIEWEMFPALTVGAKMVVASANGHKSPEYIANTVKKHSVDVFMITPSVFDLVLDFHEGQGSAQPLKSLKHVVTVGEPLPCALANRAVGMRGINAKVHNFYGASESSCTIYTVPPEGIDLGTYPNKAPAGRPQPYASVHLMRKDDNGFTAVPLGKDGEILFGGVSAAGYWQRDELTAEKWVTLPGVGRVYRTGDRGRWTAGQLEVVGRLDRQVKIRGVRIEPEEVESCLKKLAITDCEKSQNALKTVAVVPTDEPAELVAFADVRDGVGEVTADQLKAHCVTNLTPAYVPKYFVVLNDFPHLPNGKPNLSKLKELAKVHAEDAGEVVMDSLGQMKTLSRWAITERQVIHRCYAFWMLGVLTDHYCRCGMGKDAFHETLGFCNPLATSRVPPWTELMMRAVGNNQDMFGFIMLGAYQDSQPASRNTKPRVNFGKKDLFVLFVYLLMAVPITPFMDLFEDTRGKPHDWTYAGYNWSQSNHRWYLLMTFWARLYMQICEWLKVPGLIQSFIIVLPIIIPNGAADFCDDKWGAPDGLKFFLTLMFRSNGSGACPMFLAWFSIYTMCYVWSYNFIRPAMNLATKRLPSGATWAAVALAASMFIGVAAPLIHYPFTSVDDGTHMQWLPFEVAIGFIQPTLFALAMTQFPVNMAWWGNTSLGCYVFHFYFRVRMTELVLSMVDVFAFDPTGIILFLAILVVCVIVQSTIGPLGHHALVGLQYVPAALRKVFARGFSKKPAQGKLPA